MTRIAVIGNLAVDRVAGGAPRAGGSVFYAACAAAWLDVDVSLATRCAPEDADVALAPLEALGLPLTWRAGARTTAFAFHYEGERRVMTLEAVGDPWTPADVEGWAAPALEGAGWVHVGALLRSDFGAATLDAAARRGRRLLVDAQGLVRLPRTGPLSRDGELESGVLAAVHALKLSESEALLLAGGTDEESLRSLGVPEVVLTLGSAGSLVVTGDTAERVAAEPVAVSDPTGAGDTYAVGYVAARAAGATPVEAARQAGDVVTRVLAARGQA
jgi:sugar/nucleoside kinase (ribokinase family)